MRSESREREPTAATRAFLDKTNWATYDRNEETVDEA